MNVLEDILGGADNGGQVDELQKELDGTTTSKRYFVFISNPNQKWLDRFVFAEKIL